jgi:hypothetical protein
MPGTLVITTLSDGTNSTSATNCIQGSAKAWVNFNGTGTVAIRASYNVSSITDNGAGSYSVNFTTAMPDANYSVVTTTKAVGSLDFKSPLNETPISSRFSLYTVAGTTATDSDVICAAVFR